MTSVMPGLRPASSGLCLTARPTGTAKSHTPGPLRASLGDSPFSQRSLDSASGSELSAANMTANPKLSVIEVEALMREKVKLKHKDLQQAFQTYDVNQGLSITKGEFRRVLEMFCFPMTTEQFNDVMQKIDLNPNGTVRYCDFLDKFYNKDADRQQRWLSGTHRYMQSQAPPKEMNTDMVEKILRDKVQKNMKNVVKGLRLYDYNNDGHIQRHELRKVLETYCFRFTDQQFDKLYQRYDFHHTGLIDYRDFLRRLGVAVAERQNMPSPQGTRGALNWQAIDQRKNGLLRPEIKRAEDPLLAGMNLDTIEVEFRSKMRSNYANLKRMFMAMDKHLDGFVDIEDLKSVLSRFVLPVSDQLFSQLMERIGIKASGRVAWEFFLEKFQDPQAAGNGQTIPIKPNHKYFPQRGAQEQLSLRDVIRLLDQHVKGAYNSFKEAFLQLDKNRDGKISRKELKNIIESFKFRLSPGQFRELMIILDPQHTNFICYHKFLELFEERETKEGHKWLKSVHRFNENPKPAIMAWETVEELLQEKITLNWRDFAAAVVSYDDKGEGKLPPRTLRKIIEKFCLPVSDEHFQNLISRVEDSEGGKVNYTEFLTMLGVDVRPSDLHGLSTQIHDGSKQEEKRMLDDQITRHTNMIQNTENRLQEMSAEEVITRLKDRMSQHSSKIRQSFLSFDKSGKGRIGKKSFRQVLEDMGMYLSDEQFRELCSMLAFNKGHMTYTDFVLCFEDSRAGPTEDLIKASNHKCNPIRGDQHGMTAVEVEAKLRKKLRENFENLRGAFYKFDDDHNGVLTKGNFRRLLDSFMIFISDDEFEKLCQRLEIDKKSRISYVDFLNKFEVRDDMVDGHKWLNSDHRFNEVQEVQPMTAEEVHAALVEKAHQQYQDIAKAFCTMDSKGKNVITKKEMRDTLFRFILPIAKEQFKQLWSMYDKEGKGYVTHEEFLARLTGEQFAPSDKQGTSQQIVQNSYKSLEEHHQSQQAKHEQITLHQASHIGAFSVDNILRQLKDRIRDTYKDFYTAFRKYDNKKRGFLTPNDMQRILVDFNYFLDDDQLFDFLDKLGLTSRRSRLHYDDFLKVFEEGRKENYKPKQKDVRIIAYDKLSPEDAASRMQVKAGSQADVLIKAFSAFDRFGRGMVPVTDFRRVLDNFCFKMTDSQFKHLMMKLPNSSGNQVDYQNFLNGVRQGDIEDTEQWLESIERRLLPESPRPLPMEDVNDYLAEQITANFYPLARTIAELDYAKIGVITKDDFRDVLNRHTIRITDDQFEKLWSQQKVNEFGNLDYRDFFKRYTMEDALREPTPVLEERALRPTSRARTQLDIPRRPQTSNSEYGRGSRLGARSSMGSRPFTPMINAENIESKMQAKVTKHWRDIQRQCRAFDPNNKGEVTFDDFKYILSKYNMPVDQEEVRQLLSKYELRSTGKFCYTDFLRHFLLDSHEKEDDLMARKKLTKGRVPTSTGTRNKSFDDAMLRLRACVLDHWKDMRRDFRAVDKQGSGVVTPMQFRQVLRTYQVNLTEDEFYHLLTFYDKDLTGRIGYNDFISAFLKTA